MKITENTFFHNNNLDVLKKMDDKSINMIYMDPPFNANKKFTGILKDKYKVELQTFFKYKGIEWKKEYESPEFSDIWRKEDVDPYAEFEIAAKNEELSRFLKTVELNQHESHFSYLTFMAVRLIECQRILKDTGSIFYHCDHSMSHYVKAMLDIIFGAKNFRNDIIWKYTKIGNSTKQFLANYDNIFFYSKGNTNKFEHVKIKFPKPIKRQVRKSVDGILTGSRDENGNVEYYTVTHKNADNLWDDIPIVMPASSEKIGYPTQKPVKLLKRIIECSTEEGDIILDPFCGCATACVAAEQLNRKWIGIDINEIAVGLIQYRLAKEIQGWNANELAFGTLSMDFGDKTVINTEKIAPIVQKEIESHIYICQEIRSKKVYTEKKIGKANILANRLDSLNGTLSPTKYIYTAAWKVKDVLTVESELHKLFKAYREIGEWFLDPKDELLLSMESVMKLAGGIKIKQKELDILNDKYLSNMLAEASKIELTIEERVTNAIVEFNKLEAKYFITMRNICKHDKHFTTHSDITYYLKAQLRKGFKRELGNLANTAAQIELAKNACSHRWEGKEGTKLAAIIAGVVAIKDLDLDA